MARSEKITKQELKGDRFVTLTLEFYEFLKKNLQKIIISVGIIIVIIAAFSIYYHNKQQKEAAASIAMEKAINVFEEAENAWTDQNQVANDEEETDPEESSNEDENKYEEARASFDDIINHYGDSHYADKALYYSAKASYQIGEYDQAIQKFQQVVERYPNSLFALYAQSALGSCYEQKGGEDNLRKAILEYAPMKFGKFPAFPQQEHVVVQSLFHQAILYEKLGQANDALNTYNQIIEMFNKNLGKAIEDKTSSLLEESKTLLDEITKIPGALDGAMKTNIAKAQSYVTGEYEKGLELYSDVIHLYKKQQMSESGISEELQTQISDYDKRAEDFIKNLREARRYESEEQQSQALSAYGRAVDFTFAPTRQLYENALLQRDRLQISLPSIEQKGNK